VPLLQTRWPLFGALVAGGAALALFWWVTLENPKGEAVPASGGSYTEGVTRPPERINPLYANANPTDADLASLIFSGLVRLGPDGTPQPGLAERWEITNNGQRYVFHLRRGMEWHDGVDVDAEDVVFTYRAIADPAFKGDPALGQLMQDVVVTARDPLTVEFQLEQTYAPFLAWLTTGILPRHILQGLDADQLYNASFNLRPVGTGPYRVVARDEEGNIELEANPTYYLGPPRISRFAFRPYKTREELAAALRDGEVDGAALDEGAAEDDLAFFRGDGRWTVTALPAAPYYMLFLNTQLPVFAEQKVRRALFQGINRETLVAEVALGDGTISMTGIPPGSWAAGDAAMPPFDPGAAATALELAGFYRARDGTRSNVDNLRLSFTIATADDPRRVAIAEDIARQWKAIGVDATVRAQDAGTFLEERLLGRDFEAALVLVDPGPDPDPYPFWHTSQIRPPGLNLAGFSDQRLDDVLQRARQTTDTERRQALYAQFAAYLITEMPSIPLYAPSVVYVRAARVRGAEPRVVFGGSGRFADANAWYVETRVR
jgi:peptide/nickel transport system substrate-binding protein